MSIVKNQLRQTCCRLHLICMLGELGSLLLLLSGTGPASHLRDHGITVVVDQPMVGQGMTDNPMNVLFIPSHISIEVSLQVVDSASFGSYIEHPVVQALFQLPIRDLLKTMSQLKSGI
ncbi:hypothetical protein OIU77_000087 [Salix suchowensis]|uniref:Glucose-methanol-choline oxidoreductase N-terminal domain-containing protein n=1 Tax=Salix suchowensis TaxID=1278906 RepID=A0ABQ9B6S2_9ROSI|nr:hypothetical protein OIU77_000087 [Salix suchowensis]